jgi:hypothetical protein
MQIVFDLQTFTDTLWADAPYFLLLAPAYALYRLARHLDRRE